MDSGRALLLLLLLLTTGWGHAAGTEGADGAASWDGDQVFAEEGGPLPPQDAEALGTLLHFLLQALRRPSRSPAFLFPPQRFGRAGRGPWSQDRLSARTGEGPGSPFWSLIAPQRFGKK